jgi:hypothetical protein
VLECGNRSGIHQRVPSAVINAGRLTPVAMNMLHLADLRLTVKICTYIRERLVLMGIDPMLAVSLRVGDEAAAELAADEAAAELATDELHDHGEGDHDTATLDILDKKIGLIEATYRNGRRPDFAKKPLVSLLAFCFAFGDGPYRVTLALTHTRA